MLPASIESPNSFSVTLRLDLSFTVNKIRRYSVGVLSSASIFSSRTFFENHMLVFEQPFTSLKPQLADAERNMST